MNVHDWAETVGGVVTALGLPVAIASFAIRKRRELATMRAEAVAAQARHDAQTFDSLHAEYVDWLRLQMQFPELDLGEVPLDHPPELDDLGRARQVAMFNVFISLIERAYRLYAATSDRARVAEWSGWEDYIDSQLSRDTLWELWKEQAGQYDSDFFTAITQRLERRRAVSLDRVVVERVGASDPRAIELVVHAGSDPAGYFNTYLPRGVDAAGATAWLDRIGEHRFLVSSDGTPAALLMAHTPRSPGVPPGHLETGTYVRSEYRGLGLASCAWTEIEGILRAGGVPGLAGVVWEQNRAASVRLERTGYREVDRVFYSGESPDDDGWCRVWVKALAHGTELA